MKTYTTDELKTILDKHAKWCRGETGGERANLYGASLSYANLSRANLSDADLSDANLSDADLSDANLSDADLSGANLSGAYLSCARLYSANLSGANLYGAYLYGAYLYGANLYGANLSCAYLSGANLSYANLSGADLSGAHLSGANLSGAKLDEIRKDYREVLSKAPAEVLGLYDALQKGRINGSSYTGECACLVGTVANIRKESYETLNIDLIPDSSRPAERWFLGIKKGDIPMNNQVSEITAKWTEEWLTERGIKFPRYGIVKLKD